MKPEELAERLTPFLLEQSGAERVRVENVRSMTGGAAREAWSLDVTLERAGGDAERQELVLLLFRPGGQRSFSAREEYELLSALRVAGAPVPKPMWFGEAALSRPFYAMERLTGETIGRRLVREDRFAEARRRLPGEFAEALAAIHRVSIEGNALAFLPRPEPGLQVALSELERLELLYRAIAVEPHPVFEIALRWLRARAPEVSVTTLVHGDFRIGNVMVDETGLRAVLDWELAHIGDPIEDLAWMCVRSWRFGRDDLTCGGIGSREDFFSAYEKASGRTVDRDVARFWEVYGNLRWGVFTLVQVRGFLDGISTSVELASIGRRAAETEWELLNLIEGGG